MGATIAFIGLGNMGLPMARRLLQAGHSLNLWNRTRSRCGSLEEEGGRISASPSEAVGGADFVITMLADDAALLETAAGLNGFVSAMKSGALHLDMSTVSAATSRRLGQLHSGQQTSFVAAPVFGGPDASAQGKLLICAAGEQELESRCRFLFEALGRGYLWIGEDPGLSSISKLAGNFMFLCLIESLSEAFVFVEKQGIDPTTFFQVMNQLFGSPLYEAFGRRILGRQFQPARFSLRLGLKDANLILEASQAVAAPLPIASLVRNHLLTSVARGREEWDLSSMMLVARENAGLV